MSPKAILARTIVKPSSVVGLRGSRAPRWPGSAVGGLAGPTLLSEVGACGRRKLEAGKGPAHQSPRPRGQRSSKLVRWARRGRQCHRCPASLPDASAGAELVIVAEGVFSDPLAKRLPAHARTAGRRREEGPPGRSMMCSVRLQKPSRTGSRPRRISVAPTISRSESESTRRRCKSLSALTASSSTTQRGACSNRRANARRCCSSSGSCRSQRSVRSSEGSEVRRGPPARARRPRQPPRSGRARRDGAQRRAACRAADRVAAA